VSASVEPLPEDVLAALRALDTPTVCNALEEAAPERHGFGYTTTPLVCARPEAPPIVGYARTAKIAALHPSTRDAEAERASRLGYYRHVAEPPLPTVTVVEDVDPVPGYGAWWGEVNSNIHRGLGSAGVITNGSIRDLDVWADGFQALAGSVGPSHAYVHVVDVAVPVTVAGMLVRSGDLIHADRHGAVIVPVGVAALVPAAAERLAAREAVLIEAAKRPDFSIDVLARLVGGDADHH
jgi:regulator of RNase E activity RraA